MNGSDPRLDPVQAMLAQTALATSLFAPTSRYCGIDIATIEQNGLPLAYVKRRFVPPPEPMQTVQQYTLRQGDRLDVLAAQFLGDPTLFWRLCDANRAMRPWTLTQTPGAVLRITLPPGVTGAAL
ncbi:LysM domain-containing protein [Paraburkholderia sp. J7]|uniref:LysM domain-containing protein n=1 Tax=Paraburkholderia sp. J7 TaxID=2805438 RepID=UPI002AB7BF8E|nr:LysM domain-containing protein [Paraburkholderia sp. J7]